VQSYGHFKRLKTIKNVTHWWKLVFQQIGSFGWNSVLLNNLILYTKKIKLKSKNLWRFNLFRRPSSDKSWYEKLVLFPSLPITTSILSTVSF